MALRRKGTVLFLSALAILALAVLVFERRKAAIANRPYSKAHLPSLIDRKRLSRLEAVVEATRPRHLTATELQSLTTAGFVDGLRSLVAQHPALKLNDEEFAKFSGLVILYLKVNGELKSESATVVRSNDGTISISIPSRPEDARQLAALFQEDLAREIGADSGSAIMSNMNDDLANVYSGYGIAAETYTLAPVPGQPGIFKILYSSKMPDDSMTNEAVNFLHTNLAGNGSSTEPLSITQAAYLPQYSFLPKLLAQ